MSASAVGRFSRIAWSIGVPATALAALISGPSISPAQAVTYYPYCARIYIQNGSYDDCSFSNYAQCQASASGRSAECFRDPFYPGAPGTPYIIKQPRVQYSPFGSNIDPNYDPYRGYFQEQAPAPKRHHKKKKH